MLDPVQVDQELTSDQIQRICHRNFGVGSDGILLGPLIETEPRFPNRTNVQFMKVLTGLTFSWKSGSGARVIPWLPAVAAACGHRRPQAGTV